MPGRTQLDSVRKCVRRAKAGLSAFSNGTGASGIFLNQRTQDLEVPRLRMFDVEHGVNRKVVPLLCRDAKPPQSCVYERGPPGCGHLYHAESTNRMKGVPAVAREGNHRIAQGERFGNDGIGRRKQPKKTRKTF